MKQISSWTPQEELRLTGTLCAETIEELLELSSQVSQNTDARSYDIAGGFASSECIEGATKEIRAKMAGKGVVPRKLIQKTLDELDDVGQAINESSAYAREQLKRLTQEIDRSLQRS